MSVELLATLILHLLFLAAVRCEGGQSSNGGWLEATAEDTAKYGTSVCNIDEVFVDELTEDTFERQYKLKKPLIIKFRNGAADWCDVDKWTVDGIRQAYGDWNLTAGKAIEIVYTGGRPDMFTSFDQFLGQMRSSNLETADPTYLFDRSFFPKSSLPATVKVPSYLFTKEDTIFFLGGSGTGATFHKHMPAWNGVVFGKKRWILYPVEKTPPGGLHGYSSATWLKYVYPYLKDEDKPIECIQGAGDIFYVPESYYHAIVNIGETIAVSLQLTRAITELEVEFYRAIEVGFQSSLSDEERQKRNMPMHKTKNQLAMESLQLYTDLHVLLPNNTEVLSHLASLQWQLKRDVKARKIYEKIISMDRFFVKAYIILAQWFSGQGMPEEAIKTYQAALEVNPANKEAWKDYGSQLWHLGRLKEARDAYIKHWDLTDKQTQEGQTAHGYIAQLNKTLEADEDLPRGPRVVEPLGPRGLARPALSSKRGVAY